ncbi:MAG: T9SS type A sorting domain-containing protein [Bacteroidota bacterium]
MRFLMIGTLLCLSYALPAQIQNDNINFIWRIEELFANFDDPEVLEFEEEYTMTFAQSSVIETPDDHPLCYNFDGNGSASFTPTSIANNFGDNRDPADEFWINLFAWEDDGGERCEFDDGDDAFTVTWARISGETVPGTGGPSRWLTNTGNFGAECVGDAQSPPSTLFNYCYSIIWRHVSGDNANDPLIFNNNFFTGAKSHFNSNRSGEATGGDSYYSDQYGDPSPDVFYSFELTQDYANVVITTDFPETNFDTKIYLLQGGELIDENDDIAGADNRKSKIERSLCAGFYQVVVEGFDTSEGDFKIEVDATGFVGEIEASSTIVPANCEGAADGEIVVEASFGVPPYTYTLVPDNGDPEIDFDGMFEELVGGSTYAYRVTDFCGESVLSNNFTVGVDDTIDPVAVCVGATLTLGDDEGETMLDESEIAQLGGQSTDNCGDIAEVTIFPNIISPADAPIFSYELTVFDAAGNANSALCELNINILSSVDQNPELDAAITTYPNPTTDWLEVNIEDLDMDRGEIYLRDQMGRIIAHESILQTTRNYQTNFDLSNQPAGIFTLQILTPEGQLTRRIIKQ